MKSVTAVVIMCALAACAHSLITESCLDCLKTVEGGTANQCTPNADNILVCGEYKLSEEFYILCSIPEPGWDWQSCAFDDTCARWCIKLFMSYSEDMCAVFLGGAVADLKCHHYGRMFNNGGFEAAEGCLNPATCVYAQSVRTQCYGDDPTDGTSDFEVFLNHESICV